MEGRGSTDWARPGLKETVPLRPQAQAGSNHNCTLRTRAVALVKGKEQPMRGALKPATPCGLHDALRGFPNRLTTP